MFNIDQYQVEHFATATIDFSGEHQGGQRG
jgi:hypothetical protein